jgi:chromosomal replication initiation ATPase DnaA|tara:strand:+ start:338 stop:742 length:405 start_codon:yes stop_codon:yes gene_type:complete
MNPMIYVGTLKKSTPLGKLKKETILKAICIELEMDFKEVKSRKTREKEFAYARHLYAYFCRNYTNESFESIGKFINKNHATIIHSNKTIENWIEVDKTVKLDTDKINAILNFKVINMSEDLMETIGDEIILKYQ